MSPLSRADARAILHVLEEAGRPLPYCLVLRHLERVGYDAVRLASFATLERLGLIASTLSGTSTIYRLTGYSASTTA